MENDTKYVGLSLLIIGALVFLIAMVIPSEPKCIMSDCKEEAEAGSDYCCLHELSYRAYGNPDYHEVYENSKRNRKTYSTDSDYTDSSNTSNKTTTRKRYSSSKSTYNTYNSYDEGYEDIYDNDDYDSDRYEIDDDYANGVDDAMDELDW